LRKGLESEAALVVRQIQQLEAYSRNQNNIDFLLAMNKFSQSVISIHRYMTQDFINFNSKAKIKDMVEILIKDSKSKADYIDSLCNENVINKSFQQWQLVPLKCISIFSSTFWL
jgi:hypothetical protein